jgi:hypothetical protein
MQLRRERARLVARLGEEAYRGMQAGSLDTEDLDRTYKKIVAMDEQIAAKEAEVEAIRREEEAASKAPGKKAKTGANKAASSKKKSKAAAEEDEEEEEDDEDE